MDSAQVGGEESGSAAGLAAEGRNCRLCCSGGGDEDRAKLSPVCGSALLLKKIYECTAVQITAGVDQNAQICGGCIDKIDDFYAYRVQCQANDDRIRKQHMPQLVAIKQEKDLPLEGASGDPPSSNRKTCSRPSAAMTTKMTAAANESKSNHEFLQTLGLEKITAHGEHNQVLTTDEITIKRETIVDDDDVYYNSEGEQQQPSASSSSAQKPNYRIIMAANNRERLVYEGYLYCKHFMRRDGSTHWRCRLNGCQAAVNLMLDNMIVPANSNGHCHPENAPSEDHQADEPLLADCSGEFTMTTEEQEAAEDGDPAAESEAVQVESDSLQIVMNKKKGETLIHMGFKYCKRYLKMDGSTFWKCRSNNNRCNAGVYVYPDDRVRYHGEHNHDKVVHEGEDQDPDGTMDGEVPQGYTIIEDVEDDDDDAEQGGVDYSDDIAALLTNSLEVMMPGDERKSQQQRPNFEITTNLKGRECLIYEGHQYSKDRDRADGAVLWRCRRNYDKCRALAIVLPDGSVEKCGDHQHETDKRYLERREQGDGSRLYRIAKNQRGNDALVFDGHRFSKEWSRVDGSIIWRCSFRSGVCKVKVVLNAEGFVHRMGTEQEHDHETTEPPITEEAATPFVDEDVEIVDEDCSIVVSPVRNRPKLMPPPIATQFHNSNVTAEQQAAGGYRIVKNRKGFEALVHDGFRYCKVRVRQDGSVKWLCKMNKKTCRAAVDLLTDGTIAKASEFDHNHERPADVEEHEEDDDGDAPSQEITFPIDPEVFGSSQWYYVKNSKNGMSMIHAGYRYTKKCDRVDGTSLWRCSAAQRGCKAGVILFPNDTLAMVENAEHSHKPYESVKRPPDYDQGVEELQNAEVIEIPETDDNGQMDDSEMNMHSLLQTVLGTDDLSGWSGANDSEVDPNCESVWYNSATDRPYPKPQQGPLTFRIIKNRRNTDSLVHRGYRYCKMRDRVDGSILWACQMNKKTCKAAVNLTTDGRVELLNGKHNHEKTDIDDLGAGDAEDHDEVVYCPSTDVEPVNEESIPGTAIKTVNPPAKHPDYYFSVNKSNRECLIHKGFRFCKRSERPDGTTSWRCSMGGNTCMVVVTIHADGTPEENAIKHNHQPLAELPPEVERVPRPEPPVEIPKPATSGTTHKRQGDLLEWNGFHYRKIKELPDGSIIWICQIDSCRVAVKMLPNGQLKMLSESEHNHTAVGHLPSVGASGAASTSKSAAPAGTDTAGGKGRSYRLFKNQRGQMTMLYNGYRYSIRNRNQDGSSSWKCRANSTCRVTIFLMPDDRIVMGSSSTEHNHEPNWESTKKLEVVSQTRVNPLYDYLNIVPGGSNQSTGKAQTAKPDRPVVSVAAASQQSQAPAAPVPDASSFGRNVIEHKGFYYKLVVRKKNGREYWRCVHFKTRVCRAALFCRDNGTVVTSSNGKEHTHSGGADARPVPSVNSNKLLAPSASQQQVRSVVQPSPPDEVQLTVGDEERYIDHGDYVIAKNRKDQNTLIFKDRRYYLSYNRSDGSAVWRCAHRKRYKCYAYVRLRPDGRLLSTGDHEHSHTSKTDEQIPQAQTALRGAVETRNYRIVKNRVGNDILIHDSHRFRLNYQRNDGTTHWRCIWARSNHCSAGVYLFSTGLLRNAANEAAIIHNHPPPGQVKKAVTANAPAQLNQQGGQHAVASGGGQSSRTIPEDDGISDYKFVEEGSNKILTCRGYRYWYTWIRKDGSIYYRCAEVKNLQCPMGILLLPNRKLIRANDNCHNHDASPDEQEEEFLGFPAEVVQHVDLSHQQQQQQQQHDIEVFEQFPPLAIPPGGDADFKIVKTSRGESLIYKGYRYWAKNRLANGVVSLCCTRKKMKKCPAMLRLMTDGRVTDPIGAGHTHPPSIENNSGGGGGEVVRVRPPPVPTKSMVVLPMREPAALAREPPLPVTPAAKLTALSFNEESDDDTDTVDETLMGSKRYSFVKSSSQRNFIVYQDFLYDFEHKQHDGCVFYKCKTSEVCPATLMLLTNGRVMSDEVLHIHDKPDLSNMRPVGRGSKEFKIVQNKNGSNILVHRGHRYTTPRAKTDGAGIWYCHTYIPDVTRRCYVPIELLPNGRVAPVGDKQHNHKAPFKTKHDADNESAAVGNGVGDPGAVKAENNRMLLLGGHRYNYAHKRDDGAVLWKCAQKSCNASMYRLTDGHIVRGPEHNHEKMESFDSAAAPQPTTATSVKRKFSELNHTKAKSSSPIVPALGSSRPAQQHSRGGPESPVKINPYIGKSIINEGYRYIYYLTRRDGSEHWRCCRRISMKCRGGLFKQVDGTLMKSNDEGHSHPPDHADHEDFIPMPSTLEEPPHHEESNDTVVVELEEEEPTSIDEGAPAVVVEDEGSYDYELIDVKGKKRGFYLVHKGAMFVTGHTRRDRARYYRCRTVGCKVAMLLHRNGLLVRSNEHTHDCQNAVKPEEDDKIASLAQESEELSNGGIPEEKKPRLDELDVQEVVEVSPEEVVKEPDVEESISNSNESTECVVVEVKDDESL